MPSRSTLIRWGGLAALFAGALYFLGAILKLRPLPWRALPFAFFLLDVPLPRWRARCSRPSASRLCRTPNRCCWLRVMVGDERGDPTPRY